MISDSAMALWVGQKVGDIARTLGVPVARRTSFNWIALLEDDFRCDDAG